MPTGYAGEGKRYSKKLGRWLKAEKEKTFDYDTVNRDSAGLLISFFRWYPDYLADMLRSPNARYRLEFPQRMMMRVIARYRNVYITGCRGLTKTYVMLLSKMIEGVLFPGEIMRYVAPAQQQAAKLAVDAGAIPETVEIIEVEDVPLAYCVGNTCRVRVKAAGDLA